MRIALGLEYDGSRYHGWQSQPAVINVQDTLQSALSGVASARIEVLAAGRTDTGVHALEQVVHFDTTAARPLSAWVRGANALLPSGVSVLWAHEVTEEFHARFSAHARSYQYILINRPSRLGVHHGKAGWFHVPLDVEVMRAAAQHLLGEHDFSAFRSSECQAKTPVKHLYRLDITQYGDTILFDLTANAFLHHMVRNIVGSLIYVGKGKHAPQWLAEVLARCDRKHAAPTFMPDGLYLKRIHYPSEWQLPQLKFE